MWALIERGDGREIRERVKGPVSGKTNAKQWAQDRERHLLLHGKPKPIAQKEVATLKSFSPTFLDGQGRANRQKPSRIAAKEMILRVHLVPLLGHARLDMISTSEVQQLKAKLGGESSQDREQHPERSEHAAQDGRRVERDRPDACSIRQVRAFRLAGLEKVGVHILRHTFCSHLATLGAPAGAIQALVGHRDLPMTQRYMHHSPSGLDAAIGLLDKRDVEASKLREPRRLEK